MVALQWQECGRYLRVAMPVDLDLDGLMVLICSQSIARGGRNTNFSARILTTYCDVSAFMVAERSSSSTEMSRVDGRERELIKSFKLVEESQLTGRI